VGPLVHGDPAEDGRGEVRADLSSEKDAGAYEDLKLAKSYSDHEQYHQKHAILRRLIKERPDDFFVDSRQGRFVGITHRPTGFRLHLPQHIVPTVMREKDAATAEEVDAAAAEADPNPSEAQRAAGNYRKGHVWVVGLPLTIETGRGSYRRGVGKDGTPWQTLMKHHYGYIKRTESEADGDHVDIFLGPDPKSEIVFVVDQHDPATDRFDEHKCMLGFHTKAEASKAYLDNYEVGWKGKGKVHALTVSQFKWWLEHGDTSKPIEPGYFDRLAKAAALLDPASLQPQQREVADTAKEDEKRLLVYHSLGAGKTRAAIAAAETAGAPYTAVTPASLRPNFEKEVKKWTDRQLPHHTVSYNAVAKGTVPSSDTLVFDEAHRLRSPDSLTTQHAKELADQAKHLYLLSGSPIVNHPHDLAPMISMLTGKDFSPEEFDNTFVDERKISPGFWGWLKGIPPATVPAMKNEPYFENLLRGHVHYYAPQKPDVDTSEEHYVSDLGPEQQSLYQGFWGQLPFILRWKLQSNFPLSKQELLRLSSFLSGPRQVSLSTYPFMRGNADAYKAYEQSPKLQLAVGKMLDALKAHKDWRGVAFSNFIDAGLTPYAAALAAHKIPYGVFHGGLGDAARKQVVDDYNSGKSRVLLLGPSGGEGISLKGTRLLQILDPHWNSTRTTQAIGRGVRFDSHVDLPADERKVLIQRFASRLPKTIWQKLWRHVTGEPDNPRRDSPGVDFYLEQMNARKDELNNQFLHALQEVGSQKAAEDYEHLKDYVRAVVRGVDASELCGVWYQAGDEPRVRVSVGDWAEKQTYEHFKQLTYVLGEGHVEIEAEIGAPEGEGWEKMTP
jgi:hypothetical protein